MVSLLRKSCHSGHGGKKTSPLQPNQRSSKPDSRQARWPESEKPAEGSPPVRTFSRSMTISSKDLVPYLHGMTFPVDVLAAKDERVMFRMDLPKYITRT